MEKNMDKENMSRPNLSIMDLLMTISLTPLDLSSIRMDRSTKEIFRGAKKMGKVLIHGRMGLIMKVFIKMI